MSNDKLIVAIDDLTPQRVASLVEEAQMFFARIDEIRIVRFPDKERTFQYEASGLPNKA